jgi:hypothetical protein
MSGLVDFVTNEIVQPLVDQTQNAGTTLTAGFSQAANDVNNIISQLIQWGQDEANTFMQELDDLKNQSQQNFDLVTDYFTAADALNKAIVLVQAQFSSISDNTARYNSIEQWLSTENVNLNLQLSSYVWDFIQKFKTVLSLLKRLINELCGDDLDSLLRQHDPLFYSLIVNDR